jgi:hypothetical protein
MRICAASIPSPAVFLLEPALLLPVAPHQWAEKNSCGSEQYYSKRFAHDCNPFSRRHDLHSSQAYQISRSSGSHAPSSQQSRPRQHATVA